MRPGVVVFATKRRKWEGEKVAIMGGRAKAGRINLLAGNSNGGSL
jgi:hypothetical protein